MAALVAGCSQAPAAADWRPLTPEEAQLKPVLDARDENRVERSFGDLASGHKPVNPPRRAPMGVRWSDVELAVPEACADAEMAVVETFLSDDKSRYEFRLKTIEDFPATLTVQRTNDSSVYERSATVGRFNDHPERVNDLLKALDKQMRAFGRKRKIDP